MRKLIVIIALLSLCGSHGAAEGRRALLHKARTLLYSDPRQASRYASEAIKLEDGENLEGKENPEVGEGMLLYGHAEQLLGNFDLSLRVLHDAEEVIPESDGRMRARLLMLQGRVYNKLGDYARSAELNDKATSMWRAFGDSTAVAECYNERGVMLLNMEEFVNAEHFFQRALTINRALNDLKGVAKNLNNMCLYPGNASEKLAMVKEAISINRHLGSKWSLGENYNNMARQYYYIKDYPSAHAALDVAKSVIDSIGARELMSDNYEYRSWVYAAQGDYRRAYEYLQKLSGIRAEMQQRSKLRNLELASTRRIYEENRQKAERQRQEYEIQLLHRNLLLVLCGVFMLIVVGVVFYKYYQHRKNMQLLKAREALHESEREVAQLKMRQQELELENAQAALDAHSRELTSFAAFLRSRNEMIEKIRDMLREGYKLDQGAIVQHLKKINAFIVKYINSDQSSSEIMASIEERNKDFSTRLEAAYPGLTPGERNLVMLIRGNLQTKDIAMMLGTQPRTIHVSRYRLRKSLGLDGEQDLDQYIRQL